MDKKTLVKLASVLTEDQLVELFSEDIEKVAEEEKMAELEAQYALGEYTAAAFVDELEKIAAAVEGEGSGEPEKVAAQYEDLGRQLAHDYFAELVKQAQEEAEDAQEEAEEKEDEGKEEEPAEESEEDKMKKAKEKLMAAVAKKAE